MADDYNKPNMTLPLAISYNQRGQDAYTQAVTNSKDQRKINVVYELVENSITGKKTLYVSRRPGLITGTVISGATSDYPYLTIPDPSGVATSWVAAVVDNAGTDVVVRNNLGTSSTIVTGVVSEWPQYFDRTVISGTQYGVLQTNNAASANNRAWYSSAVGSWTQISDSTYTGLSTSAVGKLEHLDGFALQMTSDNKIYNSDINSLSAWGDASYITKSIEQDVGRGLARLGNLILAFGAETVEGFVNAGQASGSPLRRVPEISERIGLQAVFGDVDVDPPISPNGSRHYYATIGKRIFFVGRRNRSAQGVFTFNGTTFEKVSTPIIDRMLINAGDFRHVCQVTVYGQDAVAISLSAYSATTQRWLMFFPHWNEWFEWTSTYAQCVNDGYNFIGIGGTGSCDELMRFSTAENYVDGNVGVSTVAIPVTLQFILPDEDGSRHLMRWCGVVGDTQSSASNLAVEFSDDDFTTFSTARNIDLTASRKKITRCGSYLKRAVRLTNSDNHALRLTSFIARVE